MTDVLKFKNKYRTKTIRLEGYDYSQNGAYFITICTKNREHFFGDVINGKMELSDIGKIVFDEWIKTPKLRPDMNLKLHEFVIMPNHFHGIIIIGENIYNTTPRRDIMHRRDTMHCVSTLGNYEQNELHCVSTLGNHKQNKFGPQSKNLSSIIRGFKIGVTKNARKINPDFAWQSRFHDHIIRDEKSFNNICEYIKYNPANWVNDTYFEVLKNEQ
ncbi:transposase [Francisella hispaniensis]|uniref:transposase n=1 Tax=Francisella hispaniensis TaxID=622488 RepID=UPI001906F10A|nr:transposase [Francisella hispaniensis]MBK2356587.1 hypothetical protein [Francisella hispaniensis]